MRELEKVIQVAQARYEKLAAKSTMRGSGMSGGIGVSGGWSIPAFGNESQPVRAREPGEEWSLPLWGSGTASHAPVSVRR